MYLKIAPQLKECLEFPDVYEEMIRDRAKQLVELPIEQWLGADISELVDESQPGGAFVPVREDEEELRMRDARR